MISRWNFLLRHLSRQLWFTSALYSLLGIFTALSALWLDPLLPADLTTKIGAGAVDRILGILASSMLAVTTFSIATMVSAYAAAANGATPRATRLLVEDRTAQTALSTFLGAFLFSIVSIVALATGAYGESGRVLLFFVTIGVIVFIVLMLLRWIDKVSRLGRVTETIDEVERAASRAMQAHARAPLMGAELAKENTARSNAVHGKAIGYIEHIDMSRLEATAKKYEMDVTLAVRAGAFVTPARSLAFMTDIADAEIRADAETAVRDAFTVGDARSYDQDPRFGLIVLSEIASRALSPAVNDPGTAIDVIGTAVRVLAILPQEKAEAEKRRQKRREKEAEKRREAKSEASEALGTEARGQSEELPPGRVFIRPLTVVEFFDNIFTPIARDGAGLVEVALRLQKAFRALAAIDPMFAAAARDHSRLALERSEVVMTLADDKRRIREAAESI